MYITRTLYSSINVTSALLHLLFPKGSFVVAMEYAYVGECVYKQSVVVILLATKLGGGILDSPCPSVCLSVCLSVDACVRLGKMISDT